VGTSAGVVANAAGQSIVYAFGGTDTEGGTGVAIRAYNVATDIWMQRSYEPRVYVLNSNGVGRIGRRLYLSGGYIDVSVTPYISRQLWAYNPETNRLIRRADMPKATADGVTGVIGGILYVLPGICWTDLFPAPGSCEQEPIRRLFRYDPAADKWGSRKSAPHFHAKGAGGVINGRFYVAGGFDDRRAPVTALDRYDPSTDTWTTLAPLPSGGRAVGAVIQGRLYVTVSGESSQVTYAYTPGTNRWTLKASPTWGHAAVVAVKLDGKPRLFALGGIRHGLPEIPSDSELYTP
jgi:N-acetylneuraminic acid mutarotase